MKKGRQKLINLSLSENCGFKLMFDSHNVNRFTICKLMFTAGEQEIDPCTPSCNFANDVINDKWY